MKYVDIEKFPRKNIYKFFKEMDYPHFSICVNVDVTELYKLSKKHNLSFFKMMVYIVSEAANSVKQFRYRIQDDRLVEYDLVHPSYIILTKEDAFNFCTVEFKSSFSVFYNNAIIKEKELKGNIDLHQPERNDLLYITSTPWFSFTSVVHPVHMHPIDSIPRIAWGKYFDEGVRKKMPLGLQVHHSLMDGFHVGIFYEVIQKYLDNLENHFDLFTKDVAIKKA